VIVFDADLVGMAVLPPKRDAILVVDSYAVPIRTGSFQPLQPIASRDAQVVEPGRHIEDLQLAATAAWELAPWELAFLALGRLAPRRSPAFRGRPLQRRRGPVVENGRFADRPKRGRAPAGPLCAYSLSRKAAADIKDIHTCTIE